jgi:hypothetical protein
MTTLHTNLTARNEIPSHFVERMIQERGHWEDNPESNLDWLQREYADYFGYWIADHTRYQDPGRYIEETGILLYGRRCQEQRRAMVVLGHHKKTSSILIELWTRRRDDADTEYVLSDAEVAELEKLMALYWKELKGSRFIRQWGRIPFDRAHRLAVRISEILTQEASHA